jgi:hypothetical protein
MFSLDPRDEGMFDVVFEHQSSAYHEAGHAVLGYLAGIGCAFVRTEATANRTTPNTGSASASAVIPRPIGASDVSQSAALKSTATAMMLYISRSIPSLVRSLKGAIVSRWACRLDRS